VMLDEVGDGAWCGHGKKVKKQKLKVQRDQKQSVPEKERPHRLPDAAF